jgi:hypothetical protein
MQHVEATLLSVELCMQARQALHLASMLMVSIFSHFLIHGMCYVFNSYNVSKLLFSCFSILRLTDSVGQVKYLCIRWSRYFKFPVS